MLLSILICHLTNRKLLLERLMKCLQPQVDAANEHGVICETIVEADSGEKTTGEKRNILLGKATGKVICYVDDDDFVNEQYVALILQAIRNNPEADCCELHGVMYRDFMAPKKFHHSLKNGPEWRQDPSTLTYLRGPNHLSPVRIELALKAGFDKITIGEDRLYAQRLFPLLKSESPIDQVLYYYYA